MLLSLILLRHHLGNHSGNYHQCDHDDIQGRTKVLLVPVERSANESLHSSKRSAKQDSARSPIRIQLNFALDQNDKYTCKRVGQTVVWNGQAYRCGQIDVLSEGKKEVIRTTMNNVANYLHTLLSVDPLNAPFRLTNARGLFELPANQYASDCDFHLSVFSRPYGDSSTIASAHYLLKEMDSKRPIQGAVYINGQFVPETAQSESTSPNDFFYTCIHEIFHALGISQDSFLDYHPKGDNTPYSDIFCTLNDATTGKRHKFLVTPHAHKFAVMQYGVDEFVVGNSRCKSGIEIEDGGGQGTAGSHPECRIANSELMVGVSLESAGEFQRFTALSAAMLLDTGNYDINWRKVQPLLWGHRSTTANCGYINNFVTGPPGLVFPDNYIYQPSKFMDAGSKAGFTFKYYGGVAATFAYDCDLPTRDSGRLEYCRAKRFYNYNDEELIASNYPYDFQMVVQPSDGVCGKGYAVIDGIDQCTKYTIADDMESFTIEIPNGIKYGENRVFTCNASNEGQTIEYAEFVQIPGYYYEKSLRCPPVKQFINTIKMMEEKPFYTRNPLDGDDEFSVCYTSNSNPSTKDPNKPETGKDKDGDKENPKEPAKEHDTDTHSEDPKVPEKDPSPEHEPQNPAGEESSYNDNQPTADGNADQQVNNPSGESGLGGSSITIIIVVVAVVVVVVAIVAIVIFLRRRSKVEDSASNAAKVDV